MSPRPLRVLAHFDGELLEQLRAELPGVEVVPIPREGAIPAEVQGEVLLTMAWGSRNAARAVEHGVRWIHAFGTGVNAFPLEVVGDRILTCSRGASAVPIAEWVLAVMLAFEKQLPQAWVHEPPEQWSIAQLGGLHGRALGLVGLGGIGTAIAERALALGMRVRAVRRTPRPSPLPGVEMAGDLPELLAAADHLVLAAAATPLTRHLLDREALKQVKTGVHLVNIARGTLVDQDALREALDDGRVACASLDVADPEPLPAGHWLYTHPKVRFSPHVSWSAPGAIERILETFVENVRRYRAGEALLGQVDLEAGY